MDGGSAAALVVGDALLAELEGKPAKTSQAATMGRLQKCSYTHDALIDLIIQNPTWTQNQFAAEFGYTAGWLSNILASDAFQVKMAVRREEIVDPQIKASMKERFAALAIQSLKVLQDKLNSTDVSATVALRAAELGAKALGLGGHAVPAPAVPQMDRLERLADRLVALNSPQRERVINGEVLGKSVQAEGE